MPADASALFWIVATLACYALAKLCNRRFRTWWTSPLLLTCVLCLALALCLHAGYGEYMMRTDACALTISNALFKYSSI